MANRRNCLEASVIHRQITEKVVGELKIRSPVSEPRKLRYDLLRNEEDKNVNYIISDCWILSLSETVKTTRLGLIYEVTHGLTFSEQFASRFRATLDNS